jgi:hypothetical protein
MAIKHFMNLRHASNDAVSKGGLPRIQAVMLGKYKSAKRPRRASPVVMREGLRLTSVKLKPRERLREAQCKTKTIS